MTLLQAIAGVVALGHLLYLVFALLYPEKLS